MKKKVLSVGQCLVDHLAISKLFHSLGFEVEKIDTQEETIKKLKDKKSQYSLVLINRKLDVDNSEGIELLKKIKNDPEIQNTKVMIVSNYKDVQQMAQKLGALYGFGKAELDKEETKKRILQSIEN